ncbi:hypothetical protein VL20_5644 [Microcystis panniformis FACHB-1757]|uniref:Uncharacterized protein n=1 Tax=Microcystis panniformis FACHB-1757 TaxID=1638788 RepID=A0A0K1S8L3_9CHRO|nr:hypothetical protein VL20_5644 [Microcystis panniformis FACHB-1757]
MLASILDEIMANRENFPENFPIKIRGEIIHPFKSLSPSIAEGLLTNFN